MLYQTMYLSKEQDSIKKIDKVILRLNMNEKQAS